MRHYVTQRALLDRRGPTIETFCEDFVTGNTTTNVLDVECSRCHARMIAQMATSLQIARFRDSGSLHESPEGS